MWANIEQFYAFYLYWCNCKIESFKGPIKFMGHLTIEENEIVRGFVKVKKMMGGQEKVLLNLGRTWSMYVKRARKIRCTMN